MNTKMKEYTCTMVHKGLMYRVCFRGIRKGLEHTIDNKHKAKTAYKNVITRNNDPSNKSTVNSSRHLFANTARAHLRAVPENYSPYAPTKIKF